MLGALPGEAGFTREQVGKIDVNQFSTYVAVARGVAHVAAQRLAAGQVKGRSVKARVTEGENPHSMRNRYLFDSGHCAFHLGCGPICW